MTWTVIYNAILSASKSITSARLLLLLFLISTAALYFVTQSDPLKTLVATVATLALLVVVKILSVAAQLQTLFIRVLASALALFVLLIFVTWLVVLSGRALFSIPSCIPVLEECDNTSDEEPLAFSCDVFKEPEIGLANGDPLLAETMVDFQSGSAPDLFDESGPLYIGQSGRLYFRNSEGKLWETAPDREPDKGAGDRLKKDGWPADLTYTLLYTQFANMVADELRFDLESYSNPVGRIALGIEPNGDFVFLQLLRAIDKNENSVVALRRTSLGMCQTA